MAAAVPTMPLRVLLIRHAESKNNALMSRCGSASAAWQRSREADPGITEKGFQQAQALGRFLSGQVLGGESVVEGILPVAALCVSPMRRALQSLAPLATRSGLRPQVWTDCFEVGGLYDFSETGSAGHGLSREGLQKYLPGCDVPADMPEDGWYWQEGKESDESARLRARGTAQRLRELAKSPDQPNGSVAVLGHHDQLNLLLQELLHEPNKSFEHANAAMSCVSISADGCAHALFFNRTCHLRQEVIPRVDEQGIVHDIVLLRGTCQLRRRSDCPCGSQHVRRRARRRPDKCDESTLPASPAAEEDKLAHPTWMHPFSKGISRVRFQSARKPVPRESRRCAHGIHGRHGHVQRQDVPA